MSKKFNVHYSFCLSESIEVEANNEDEACKKVEEMLDKGEIGNLNEMDIDKRKVWID